MSDDLLKEIELVAHGMTADEAPRNMRAQVVARLGEPERRHWRSAWLLAPAAVAAMIALVAGLQLANSRVREFANSPTREIAKSPISTAQPPVIASAERPAPSAPLPPDTTRTTEVVRYERAGVRSAEASRYSATVAPQVVEYAPPPIELPGMNVDPLETTELTNDRVGVDPLDAIVPMAVTPLSN